MAETTSPVKKHYDYAQQQVDEQAILDKFNAATAAQYNVQREQNRQAENQFYNQMYNTQQTAMDTIRKSNAAAVSSGASRGVQAANELSAILGLEQESVASATELANANRQTAQEETAAVLENVLKAYQQATQERQQLVQQGIEAESVDVQRQATQAESEARAQETAAANATTLVSAAENGTSAYLTALSNMGKDYNTVKTAEGLASLETAMEGINKDIIGADGDIFVKTDWDGQNTGAGKAADIRNKLWLICDTYGIPRSVISDGVQKLNAIAETDAWWGGGVNNRQNVAARANAQYANILGSLQNYYREMVEVQAAKNKTTGD